MIKEHFTYEQVAEKLRYDPETGNLWWKNPRREDREHLPAGSHNNAGYRRVTLGNKVISAHRLAWLLHYGEWPQSQIDHINRIRDDNRIRNLRVVTAAENIANSDRSGRRGERRKNAKGYTFLERLKVWQVQAYCPRRGRPIYVGVFKTEKEAQSAYSAAIAEMDL